MIFLQQFFRIRNGRINVEFFSVLTEKQLKRGVFTSVDELEQKIIEYIDRNNENLKPFVWTKSAEEILEK